MRCIKFAAGEHSSHMNAYARIARHGMIWYAPQMNGHMQANAT